MVKKKTVSVSEFKSKSLGLFEEIYRTGDSIVVTKRGKPIAQVIPFQGKIAKLEPGRLRNTFVSEEDVVSPLGSKDWTATK